MNKENQLDLSEENCLPVTVSKPLLDPLLPVPPSSTKDQPLALGSSYRSILKPSSALNLLEFTPQPKKHQQKVTFETPLRLLEDKVTPTRFEDICGLDDGENWRECAAVVTKADHEDNIGAARHLVDELIDALPICQADGDLPAVFETCASSFATSKELLSQDQELLALTTDLDRLTLGSEPEVKSSQVEPGGAPSDSGQAPVDQEPVSHAVVPPVPVQPRADPSDLEVTPPQTEVKDNSEVAVDSLDTLLNSVEKTEPAELPGEPTELHNLPLEAQEPKCDSLPPEASAPPVFPLRESPPPLESVPTSESEEDLVLSFEVPLNPDPPVKPVSQNNQPLSVTPPNELNQVTAVPPSEQNQGREEGVELAEVHQQQPILQSVPPSESDVSTDTTLEPRSKVVPLEEATESEAEKVLIDSMPPPAGGVKSEAEPKVTMDEGQPLDGEAPPSPSLPIPKATYNIDWDNFDEAMNPFGTTKALSNSPPKGEKVPLPKGDANPFVTRNQMANTPPGSPMVVHAPQADVNENLTKEEGVDVNSTSNVDNNNANEKLATEEQMVIEEAAKAPTPKKTTPKKKPEMGDKQSKQAVPSKFKLPPNLNKGADSEVIQIFAPPPQMPVEEPAEEASELPPSSKEPTPDEPKTVSKKKKVPTAPLR